jgi:hypothetical protein
MPDFDFDGWWSLHLRVAKGETLSEQEQNDYQEGLDHLDDQPETAEDDTLAYLRTLRASINRAAALRTELMERGSELDVKIARLEEAYQQLTGHELSLARNAPA